MLIVLGHDLCIARISRQVDGKCDKFLADNGLRTVDNELVDDWNTLSVGERCLELVFLTHVVEELQNERAETGSFQNFN